MRGSAFLRQRYLGMDRRVLGVFRVALGSLLLGDVLRRVPEATMYFSDEGVFPARAYERWRDDDPCFSLFAWFHSPGAVVAVLLVAALVHAAYAAGLYTRVVQIVAPVLVYSVNARNLMLEDGGMSVMTALASWAVFLPLGDRYSVDEWRARRRVERAGARYAPPMSPIESFAVLGLTLQIAAIYFFSFWFKKGPTWHDGTAFHYILWQNRVATPLAVWLRTNEPAWLSPALTRGTLVIEGVAPLLVLSPVWRTPLRSVLVAATFALHLSIAATMRLGVFSWAMLVLNLAMLPPVAIDLVERRLRTRFAKAGAADDARPAAPALARAQWRWREWAARLFLVVMILEAMNDNDVLGGRQLSVFRPFIRFTRLLQAWQMFAPDAPTGDGKLVVDAVTADGRHVDPFARGGKPDLQAPLHGPWGLDAFDDSYTGAIADDHRAAYRVYLDQFLRRWHLVTGRGDGARIVSYTVYWVTSRSPEPGATEPTDIDPQRVCASSDFDRKSPPGKARK